MTFRDREKKRLEPLKARLFTERACHPGVYRGRGARLSFCLNEDFAEENLHAGIRDAALAYFAERKIGWHHGKGGLPSNHLCCSQSCCVNFWFPFVQAPQQLAAVLRGLGYDVAEMLPFEADCPLVDASHPYITDGASCRRPGRHSILPSLTPRKAGGDRDDRRLYHCRVL